MWLSFPGKSTVHCLSVLGLVTLVAAYYHVDNANNTVVYTPSRWNTYSFGTQNITLILPDADFTVDSSRCYNQNYALAACGVEDNCRITFPFTGSGVSVFVMHAGFQGITARLTIDGSQSVTATLPPPTAPSYQTPNVSLFDFQSIPSADHTATIDLLGWNNGPTSLYFDYALVNESHVELLMSPSTSFPSFSPLAATLPTNPAINSTILAIFQSSITQPATTSFTTSPALINSTLTSTTTSTVSRTKSSANVGVVVGSTCGGFAALIAATAIVCLKRRMSRHVKLRESLRPDPFPVTSPQQTLSSPVQPPTDEKMCRRLMVRNLVVYRPPRQSNGEPGEIQIISATGDTQRIPDAAAGPSTTDAWDGDFVIDCRPESDSPGIPSDSAPPGYQPAEGQITSGSSL